MSYPILLRSTMANAPVQQGIPGSFNTILTACLVDGFNAVNSTGNAEINNNVLTIYLPTGHGFNQHDTVEVSGSSENQVNTKWRVLESLPNEIRIQINLPNTILTGSITVKFASLGWSKPFADSNNVSVFKQGGDLNNSYYFRFDTANVGSSPHRLFIKGYETMTDINTGTNVFSSNNAGNGSDIVVGTFSNNNVPWLIVGNERGFYIVTGHSASTTNTFNKNDTSSVYIGEINNIFDPSDLSCQILPSSYQWPNYGSILAGNANKSSISIDAQLYGIGVLNSFCHNFNATTSAFGNILIGSRVIVFEPNTLSIRGTLPGMYSPYQSLVNNGPFMPGEVVTFNLNGNKRFVLLHNTWASGFSCNGIVCLDEDWV